MTAEDRKTLPMHLFLKEAVAQMSELAVLLNSGIYLTVSWPSAASSPCCTTAAWKSSFYLICTEGCQNMHLFLMASSPCVVQLKQKLVILYERFYGIRCTWHSTSISRRCNTPAPPSTGTHTCISTDTTGASPAELLFGRKVNTILPDMRPDPAMEREDLVRLRIRSMRTQIQVQPGIHQQEDRI